MTVGDNNVNCSAIKETISNENNSCLIIFCFVIRFWNILTALFVYVMKETDNETILLCLYKSSPEY